MAAVIDQPSPDETTAEVAGSMEVYVYETPNGKIADFRSYLTGTDHSFEGGRPMGGYDARWEKVQTLLCPRTGASLFGSLEYLGKGSIDDYHELMIFPISYAGEVESSAAPDHVQEAAES